MKHWIKICGITNAADAEDAVFARPDALGFVLWPKSPRAVTLEQATRLAKQVRGKVQIVAVVVDLTAKELAIVSKALRPDWLQLHGNESVELVRAFPNAYKAVSLGSAGDVFRAMQFPGTRILVDAPSAEKGGSGQPIPDVLAKQVTRGRTTILAGGLTPENVAARIRAISPFGVDASSGLERIPGRKDHNLMWKFVENARAAFAQSV